MIAIQHMPRRLSVSKNSKSPAPGAPDPETPGPDDTASSRPFLTLQEMEHQHILHALKTTEGNKSRAAEILGISRAALWRKLRIIAQKEA
jgi:transcriptional regulator with PAS, ATPase and Fis domain